MEGANLECVFALLEIIAVENTTRLLFFSFWPYALLVLSSSSFFILLPFQIFVLVNRGHHAHTALALGRLWTKKAP